MNVDSQERLIRKDGIVKVCDFLGITVEKVGHHIIPIIQIKPSNINLHVGENDTRNSNSRKILHNN